VKIAERRRLERNRVRREKRARDKRIIERAEFLRSLLGEFGLRLLAFDPGVCACREGETQSCHPWGGTLNFDSLEWSVLEPLLIELRDRRRAHEDTV
jgi:hypothetical protein